MNRRTFVKSALASAVAIPTIATGVGFAEAVNTQVKHVSYTLPNLPKSFDGLRVVFLTDLHHGPYMGLDFITSIVRTTKQLDPDIILHGGDYTLRDAKYIDPLFETLRPLTATLGSYGVLGNHDYKHSAELTRRGMRRAGIVELQNQTVRLTRGGEVLNLSGVTDLWYGVPDAPTALRDVRPGEACLLLSHNPDFAEKFTDTRPGLMLSGHTHGGQMNVPGMKNPFLPSFYGDKYARGFVDGPTTKVYVSCGLGLTGLPVRYNCPPELTLLTLRSPQGA
jgi:uncharacterized protein